MNHLNYQINLIMLHLVNEFQTPISVVSFSAFLDDDNKMLLVRELSEQDTQQSGRRTGTRTMEEICELANSVNKV